MALPLCICACQPSKGTETMSTEKQVVVARYTIEAFFKIPKGMELEDKTQVEWWDIRYNTLRIKPVGEEKIEIEPSYESEPDYKYPDENEILDRDDMLCGLSDSEEEDDEQAWINHPKDGSSHAYCKVCDCCVKCECCECDEKKDAVD